MTKRKRTYNDVLNTQQKTKDQAKLTHTKNWDVLKCSGSTSRSCSTRGTRSQHILNFDFQDLNSIYQIGKVIGTKSNLHITIIFGAK
jgi:hypothetical protein